MPAFDLAAIKSKLSAASQPLVDQYAPAIVAMTADEVGTFITSLLAGNTRAAFDQAVAKLPNNDLFLKAQQNLDDWDKQNAKNADRLALIRSVEMAILKGVLLPCALAAVGF